MVHEWYESNLQGEVGTHDQQARANDGALVLSGGKDLEKDPAEKRISPLEVPTRVHELLHGRTCVLYSRHGDGEGIGCRSKTAAGHAPQ